MPEDQPPSILLVVADGAARATLDESLTHAGHRVRAVATIRDARAAVAAQPPAVLVLDLDATADEAFRTVARLREAARDTEIVLLAGPDRLDEALDAAEAGAFDCVPKPLARPQRAVLTIRRALELRELRSRRKDPQPSSEHELRGAVMRLSSLIEAGRALADCRTLTELLSFFLGLVCKELEVDRASLMLIDEETGQLEIAAAHGLDEVDTQAVRVPVGQGIAGKVARTGRPLLVTDVESDPRVENGPRPNLSGSFISAPVVLSIPIKSREKTLGVINVTNRRTRRAFDEGDLDYLSGLAGQLAVAVERARSYEELEHACASLRATRDKLVFAERLKVIGQMAAGVAHDLNNALSVILTRSQRAYDKLAGTRPDALGARADLDAVRRISLEGADHIKRIQDYTRIRRDLPSEPVALDEVARMAVAGTPLGSPAGTPLELRLELGPVSPVPGDRDELIDAVSALLTNARDAMTDGGVLTLRTRQGPDRVVLEVIDSGSGMSREVCERLFEPFFTTRPGGRGLGASIAFGIVSRHNGSLTAESRTGRGSTLRIELPHADAVRLARTTRPEPSAPVPLRVLLVDDDDPVRETYEDVLRSSGHDAVAVADGLTALEVLASRPIDVVITDLSMREMTGLELAGEIKRRRPEVRIVLFSGWAMQQSQEEVRAAGIDRVLSKPCLIEELLAVLREVTPPTARG